MKKRSVLLLLVLSLFLCLVKSPAHAEISPVGREEVSADLPMELRTVVPEGVTEIDLRVALGDDASGVHDAWMLNADILVILRDLSEAGDDEIIVLDTRDNTVLSRTPIPYITYLPEQGFFDGVFYLLLTPIDADVYDASFSYVKATVAPDGTVDIGTASGMLTVMPGGKTAVRRAADASLYAVDLATGEEELLIQGVPPMTRDSGGASYETFREYVPCPDDVGYDGKDAGGYPLSMTFPIDEDTYYGNDIWFWRDFYVYKPLDEYRFVYKVSGWEWGAGFGVYDLKTRTDHRITGRGDFYGMAGNTLFGSTLMADADTLETLPLPKSVQEQFYEAYAMENGVVDYDISQDGRLLALTGMKSRRSDASTVTITDIRSGGIIKAYDIYNPFAWECDVSFYGDTRFMLFFQPGEHGSAYIYLFDAAE